MAVGSSSAEAGLQLDGLSTAEAAAEVIRCDYNPGFPPGHETAVRSMLARVLTSAETCNWTLFECTDRGSSHQVQQLGFSDGHTRHYWVGCRWLEARGAGEKQVNFKLRDWLFARQRYWGEPFPIIFPEGSDVSSA